MVCREIFMSCTVRLTHTRWLRMIPAMIAAHVAITPSAAGAPLPNMSDACCAPTKELTFELRNSFVAEIRALAADAARNQLRGAALNTKIAQAAGTQTPASPADAAPPSAEHVAMVVKAQKGAYAVSRAINKCPPPDKDVQGWPAGSLQDCIFKGDKPKNGDALIGRVVLLKLAPESVARWIETACSAQLPGVKGCFEAVLVCGKYNSGMMFPVSGNMMENMKGPWTNWFFRNGMVVRFKDQPNDSPDQISLVRQEELIFAPPEAIERIPTGLTRLWRTLPAQFAAKYPKSGAPSSLDTPAARQKWLETAKAEFSAASTNGTNRLLEAWIAAHPKTITSISALGLKLRDASNKSKKKELAPADCPADKAP